MEERVIQVSEERETYTIPEASDLFDSHLYCAFVVQEQLVPLREFFFDALVL